MIPHEELGIRPDATLEDAEAAYRRLMLQCHPDTLGDAATAARIEAEERTRVLNDAIAAIRSRRGAGTQWHGATSGAWGWEWEPPPSETAERESPGDGSVTICAVCGQAFPTTRDFRDHAATVHRIGRPVTPRREGSRLLQPAGVWTIITVVLFGLYAVMGLCLGASCDPRPDMATQTVVGALFVWLVVVPVVYWHFSD